MADIFCAVCAEPWDMDSIHDIAEERELSYNDARKLFREQGCKALGTSHNDTKLASGEALAGYAVLADFLGDDVDALVSLSEDFGLFD